MDREARRPVTAPNHARLTPTRAQRVVAQGQRRVRGAQRQRALRRESRLAQRDAVQVVVAEHEDPLARAISDVEHQAPVAPGIRMGDVAQADDGVVGSYAAPPFAKQMAVHLVDVAERAVEGLQRAGVAEVQVAPDPLFSATVVMIGIGPWSLPASSRSISQRSRKSSTSGMT